MKKQTRIAALLLSVVMLLGMVPLSVFANEVETDPVPFTSGSVTSESQILAALAEAAEGELFTGAILPESGATALYNEKGPLSFNTTTIDGGKAVDFVENEDGSKTVIGKPVSLSASNEAYINLLIRHFPIEGNKRDTMDKRYQVFSTNIRRGEAFGTENIITAEVCFNGEDGATSYKKFSPFKYVVSSDAITANDIAGGVFGNETYTNFMVIIDSETLTYTSYINGVAVCKDVAIPTPDASKTYTVRTADFYTYYTNKGVIEGTHSQHGATVSYYADVLPTFPEKGATGVFKLGEYYYYYENGKLLADTTVECGDYTLTLAGESGRIVNVEWDMADLVADYERFTCGEITAAGGTVLKDAFYESVRTNLYTDLKKYASYNGVVTTSTPTTAWKYDENGNPVQYNLAAASFYYDTAARTFTIGTKPSNTFEYYASESDLRAGTTKTISGSNLRMGYAIPSFSSSRLDGTDTYVIRQMIKFGDGIDTLLEYGKPLAEGSGMKFLMAEFYNAKTGGSNTQDFYGILTKKSDGIHLYLGGVDAGLCDTENYTDIALVINMANDKANIDFYINGALVCDDYKIGGSTAVNAFNSVEIYANERYGWEGELLTYQHTESYKADRYLEAVTDGFTGVYPNGDYSIYYENGVIVERGDYKTLAAKYGAVDEYAKLTGYNVALADVLHLNFFADLSTLTTFDGVYATLTADGKEQRIELADLTAVADGTYKFTAKLSSIQVADEVAFKLFDKDGNGITLVNGDKQSLSYNYSIKRYCEYVIDNNWKFSAQAVKLVKAILLYGAYAERNFIDGADLSTAAVISQYERASVRYHSANKLVNVTTYSNNDLVYSEVDAGAVLVGYATDKDKVGEVYLVLDSAIKIRIALNVTEAPVAVEGAKLVTKTENGETKYYVDVEGLTVKDLNTVCVVTVDGVEIGITALAAAGAVIADTEGSYDNDFKNLMRAMLAYYYYANEYVKTLGA